MVAILIVPDPEYMIVELLVTSDPLEFLTSGVPDPDKMSVEVPTLNKWVDPEDAPNVITPSTVVVATIV